MFEIGDKVLVKAHTEIVGAKSVYRSKRWVEEYEGHVCSLDRPYRGATRYNSMTVRRVVDGETKWESFELSFVSGENDNVVLLCRNDVWPLSNQELYQKRREVFNHQVSLLDQSFEGFANAATYLAWLYLNNEPRFHNWLQGNRRKDGSVNPNKVQKEFLRMGIEIDDWASQPIISTEEFKAPPPKINWREVAENFNQQLSDL